jgi:adhesin transport system membrane fusion protein
MAELRYRMATEAKSELSAIHAELARIEGTILSQNDRLSRTVVRAPVEGVINHINANTIGGVIKPGDTLIDLTPDTGEVLVEARIRPSDRGELHAGLPAKVKVMAYDHTGMAPLNGEVAEVSADTLASPQGERFYRLKIKLDAGQDNLKGKILYPGLSTQVDVVVGQRSVADYLLSPIHKFKDKAFTEAK